MTEKRSKLDPSRVHARLDPHTVSNYQQFTTEHLQLDWTVDFEERCLRGTALATLKLPGSDNREDKDREEDGKIQSPAFAGRLHFDAVGLDIRDVYLLDANDQKKRTALSYAYLKKKTNFGGDLEVILPDGFLASSASQSIVVGFDYETGHDTACLAVQWLNPEQTVGGKLPFLFTQCQAIHARSLVPCQDTPAVKFTFDATVRIAPPLLASTLTILMGANEREAQADGSVQFRQTTRVPAYLLALAVGDVQSRAIGPRSAVWAEPAQLEAAAHEFAETESFLATAERLAGPYVWGRYDILVLPSSFPYGGMENPCLTFVSASLLAGDRSLADVVAHEISHSWTGNLVTARSWEHFWLNEGWTMFLERKITGALRGESYRHFDALLGLNDLRDSVRQQTELGLDTSLYPDLRDTHPDDAFSTIPYEKGHTLLMTLEQAIETVQPGSFQDGHFIRQYVDAFAHRSIDVGDFIRFVQDWSERQSVPVAFEWERWLLAPGMPPAKDLPRYDDTLKAQCQAVVSAVLVGDFALPEALKTTHPLVYILDGLTQQSDKLAAQAFDALEHEWQLMNRQKNVEIAQKHMLLALKYKKRVDEAFEFAQRHGRMKYHRPIYQALYQLYPERCVAFYRANRHRYHPIAANLIEKDLQVSVTPQ